MADVASPRREDYCAHEESTVGCIACDYINEWEYRINGLAEHEKWSAAAKQAEKFLGLEGLNNDQKQRYTNELKTAREYKKACENNLPGLDEVVDSRKAEVDAVCSTEHPRESWPQAFQDLVGPKVEKLRAIMRRAFPDNPQVGVFVRESESTKQAQAQRSDEAGVKETQGSSSATTIDSAWQAIVDSHRQRPDFESEDMKQRYAILQKKLEEAVLDLDDRKLGLGSPLDYYDGEPILLIKLRELEREGKYAQKEQ
ncbi:hypothetical protein D0859_01261 [Hortaea werneckii]|uniref:Uncharacterized protein n=1 Tax=Hortaea werneckii TaxID=91943 RepID=A0A3M7JA07_HORWE|nr:hypothetical protein D0859_01261 [Hortaea werneckii]